MESQSASGSARVPAARRPFFRRRKSCPFSGPNAPKIDYKDIKLLQRFISERGKIVPSRITAVFCSVGLLLSRGCPARLGVLGQGEIALGPLEHQARKTL